MDDLAKVGEGKDWIVGLFQDIRQEKLKGAVDRLNDIAGNVRKVAADMDWRGEAADQAKTAFMTLASKLNEHADAIHAIRQADADTHDPISDAREAWNFLQLTRGGTFGEILLKDLKYDGEEPDETRERLAREAMDKLDTGMNGAQSRIATGVTWDLDVPATPATKPPVYGPPVPKDPKPAPEPGAKSDPDAKHPKPHGGSGDHDTPPSTGSNGGGGGGTGGGGGGAGTGGGGGAGGGGGGGGTPQVHANPLHVQPVTDLDSGGGNGHGGGNAGGGHDATITAAHPGSGNGGHGNGHDPQVQQIHGNGAQGNGDHIGGTHGGTPANGAHGNGQNVQWQAADGQWHNAVGHQVQWQDAHGQWHDAAGTGDHPNASQVRWQDSGGQWHQADGQWEDSQGQWHEARGPEVAAVADPAASAAGDVTPTATDGVDLSQQGDAPPVVADPADAPPVDAVPASDTAPTDPAPATEPPRTDYASMLEQRLGATGPVSDTVTVDVGAAARSST